ncbi:MAG TPA: hypothetical protein VG710_12680 [Opitutus sp.]|nr:hypothetical protein [Opitutus sp.]
MRNPRLFAVFVVANLLLAAPPAWGSRFMLFSRVWGDAIVVTDMTPTGRALTPASPAKPVYFQGVSLGARLGTIAGDTMPDEKKFDDFVVKTLAKQGYLAAVPHVHEPTLFLVIQWGYITGWSNLLWFLGYDPNKDFLPDFLEIHPSWAEAVLDTARDPTYGIMITAFDFKSANTRHPIVCWQTRIGLSALGKSMAQALPVMMVAAGPTIGHETNTPVLSDADIPGRGRVELGELKVLGYEDTPAPAAAPPEKQK